MSDEVTKAKRGRPPLSGIEAVRTRARQILEAIESLSAHDRNQLQQQINAKTGETVKIVTDLMKALAK